MNGNPKKIKGNFYLKSKYLLGIMVVLCCVLMVVSSINPNLGKPFKYAASGVLVPIQKGMNSIGLWFSDKSDSFRQLKEVMAENEELKEKVDDLTLENTTLFQQQNELNSLRELYNLDNTYSSYEKIAAHVVAAEPGNWFSKFQIDKGSKDGITVDMNVIGGGGLVGIVIDVGPNYAIVRSIIDDESYVGAEFSTTSDRCIVQGNLKSMEEGYIPVININKNAQVNDGDMVVTSHVSDKFLPNLLIGYASSIKNDSNNLTKSGYITPIADLAHLKEVLVITQLKDIQE